LARRSPARHFLSVLDLSHAEMDQVLALADVLASGPPDG
jgi:hypothetical protein